MVQRNSSPRVSNDRNDGRKQAASLRREWLVITACRSMTRHGLVLIVAVVFGAQLFGATVPNAVTLGFSGSSIEVQGVTPNGTVYLYGLAREPRGFITAVVPHETRLRDEDGDGRVVLELAPPFPWRSIWFAVDLESGNFAAGTPAEYVTAARIDFTSSNLKHDAAGDVEELAFDGGIVELIAVRPKTGEVWGASVLSRGGRDRGTETGKVTLPALDFDRRAGTTDPAPKKLKKGDVIFAMSSFRAKYAAARVGD